MAIQTCSPSALIPVKALLVKPFTSLFLGVVTLRRVLPEGTLRRSQYTLNISCSDGAYTAYARLDVHVKHGQRVHTAPPAFAQPVMRTMVSAAVNFSRKKRNHNRCVRTQQSGRRSRVWLCRSAASHLWSIHSEAPVHMDHSSWMQSLELLWYVIVFHKDLYWLHL